MWSVVSMHYIAVRRFPWIFNRSSLCSVNGTFHTLRATGLHFALFARCLAYNHCVWFSTMCTCLEITRAVRSLPWQRCGSSISPSRFGGADTSLILISTQHSSDVVRLLKNYDARSWHRQEMKNLSVRQKKMAVGWLCGANSDMKFQHRQSDLVGNDRFVFSLMTESWIKITNFISSRRQVKGKHHHALGILKDGKILRRWIESISSSFWSPSPRMNSTNPISSSASKARSPLMTKTIAWPRTKSSSNIFNSRCPSWKPL